MTDMGLDPQIQPYLRQNGLDTVAGAFAFTGGEDLAKPGLGHRRRTRLELRDNEHRCWVMYLKRYSTQPLLRRLWRFITARAGRCEAMTEFDNIRTIRLAGLATMREIICGVEKDLLGVKRSYIIVGEVPGDALERAGEEFITKNLHETEHIEQFTEKLVELIRGLHETGYVHRDLYASHIFLNDHEGRLELNLIDLARAFRPRRREFRWRVKDLAQLKYSMPWLWVRQYWKLFLMGYLRTEIPAILERWERAISAKVESIKHHDQRRETRGDREGTS